MDIIVKISRNGGGEGGGGVSNHKYKVRQIMSLLLSYHLNPKHSVNLRKKRNLQSFFFLIYIYIYIYLYNIPIFPIMSVHESRSFLQI